MNDNLKIANLHLASSSMKATILLDTTRLFGRLLSQRLPTGVDRVSLAYVRHFADRARAVLSLGRFNAVLSPSDSVLAFDLLLEPSHDAVRVANRLILKARLTGWRTARMPNSVLIHTAHHGLERADFSAGLLQNDTRLVCMVHDLIPITHAEYCRPGETEKHFARIRNILKLSAAILTNSQATLDELTETARYLNLDMPPAMAAHLASGLQTFGTGERPLDEPYFVVLGTVEARKNHLMLLQIWRRLAERMGAATPRLVIIGQLGWECENVIDMLERCAALQNVVLEFSNCTDREIVNWLQHAQALLFPSFIEGYGMPMIEALTLGVPVIVSDLPVFHEIADDIPEYVDPIDAIRWMELVLAYCQDDHPLRHAQLLRLQNFNPPQWRQHFETVDQLLEQMP